MGEIAEMHDKDNGVPQTSGSLNESSADAQKESGSFPAEVFDNLPGLLKDACNKLPDPSEKEVFLTGSVGVLSGIFPNVHGFYDQQFYTPHLYVFILAPYGSGKGSLSLARKLGRAIHKHKLDLSDRDILNWKAECAQAKHDKGPEPPRPNFGRLFIPADNSKSGMIQALSENKGRGIVFESEGDTLADTMKTDHGNASDVYRKAFHHEDVSLSRRTDQENREIDHPELAVVLSATFDQYQKLIPTPANGLFSRFLHFNLKSNPVFRDVFSDQRRGYPEYFDDLGEKFKAIFLKLESLESKIEFNLRPHQQARFLKLFAQWKAEFIEFVPGDTEGTANRLGLICFRISMVLSCVRCFEKNEYTGPILCTDQDFENALHIIEVFKCHALEVFHRLPKPTELKTYADDKNEFDEKADQVRECRRLKDAGMSYADIAKKVFGKEDQKQKAYRWANSEK